MIQRINLHAISNSPIFSAGLTSLFRQNNEICLSNCFSSFNSALNYFNCNFSSQKNNNVVFIDDLSLNKAETVDFLKGYGDSKLEEIKSIVYTDSVNPEYFHDILSSKARCILHDYETPLRNSLIMLTDHGSQSITQTNLNFNNMRLTWGQVNEKLIRIITLVGINCNCHDSIIMNSIKLKGFNWARGDVNCDRPLQVLMPFRGELYVAAEEINLLSKRGKEILLKIAEGEKNNEIAEEIHVSPDTVAQHKVHMIKKLGLKSAHELTVFAILHIKELLK